MSNLKKHTSNDSIDNRRIAERRFGDKCVMTVADQILPVQNWSYTGALLTADNRLFEYDQPVEFVLKFKLRDRVLDLKHSGRIVRKTNGRVAIAFDPVNAETKRTMRSVVDNYAAEEFARSQA